MGLISALEHHGDGDVLGFRQGGLPDMTDEGVVILVVLEPRQQQQLELVSVVQLLGEQGDEALKGPLQIVVSLLI